MRVEEDPHHHPYPENPGDHQVPAPREPVDDATGSFPSDRDHPGTEPPGPVLVDDADVAEYPDPEATDTEHRYTEHPLTEHTDLEATDTDRADVGPTDSEPGVVEAEPDHQTDTVRTTDEPTTTDEPSTTDEPIAADEPTPTTEFDSTDEAQAREEVQAPSEATDAEATAEATDEVADDDEAALAQVDGGEPDRPTDADLMAAAATGPGQPAETELVEAAAAEPPDEDTASEPGGRDELAPGEVPVGAVLVMWETEVVDRYRDRWQQIQLRFIDDPRRAAEQAQGLAGDVCQGLADALARHRGELDRWQAARLDDTEELRMTVRRYRDLLDRLFSL